MDKKLVKTIVIGALIIMSLGLFTGCGDDVKSLSGKKEAQIKEDYLSEYGHELNYTEFYGEYNESAVFYMIGSDTVMKEVTISGVKFIGNSGWTILVWNDGSFYNLEDIDKIFELNKIKIRNFKYLFCFIKFKLNNIQLKLKNKVMVIK